MIIPTVTFRPIVRERIAAKTLKIASARAQREMEDAGDLMVIQASGLVGRKFKRREGYRRKAVSTVHITEAFAYKVHRGNQPGGFPWRAELTIREDLSDEDRAKVAALNHPTQRDYTIRPRNPGGVLSWTDEAGRRVTSREVKRTPAQHTIRGYFMEDARDIVVRFLKRRLR